jgi:hypothetical protein
MEVEVGSFSDPEGLEGLAHFLGEFVSSPPHPRSLVASASVRCVRVLIESPSEFVSVRGVRIWARQ